MNHRFFSNRCINSGEIELELLLFVFIFEALLKPLSQFVTVAIKSRITWNLRNFDTKTGTLYKNHGKTLSFFLI